MTGGQRGGGKFGAGKFSKSAFGSQRTTQRSNFNTRFSLFKLFGQIN